MCVDYTEFGFSTSGPVVHTVEWSLNLPIRMQHVHTLPSRIALKWLRLKQILIRKCYALPSRVRSVLAAMQIKRKPGDLELIKRSLTNGIRNGSVGIIPISRKTVRQSSLCSVAISDVPCANQTRNGASFRISTVSFSIEFYILSFQFHIFLNFILKWHR